MVKIIRFLKNVFIHIRSSFRLIFLFALSILIIWLIFKFVYRPMYSVTFNGEFVGYVEDKDKLEDNIKEYMKKGDGELVAFVEIPTLPEYSVCLLKKDKVASDNEIYDMVKETGITYYRYYAVTVSEEEKVYVATTEDAEAIINKLKEENSTNKSKLSYIEKIETELKEFTSVDDAFEELYVEPVRPKITYTVAATSGSVGNLGGSNTASGVNIGIGLSQPTTGIITYPYGIRWGRMHTGIDIANNTGTAIYASAAGTVKFTGWYGGYGNLVILTHGNGVDTYYGHCSSIVVTAGQSVEQGQLIAYMGSTGNSTGPHLHLEVRVNGVTQNPQAYVYR